MNILFFDGFDSYSSTALVTNKWSGDTGTTITTAPVRRTGSRYVTLVGSSSTIFHNLGATYTTLVLGCGFRFDDAQSHGGMRFYDGTVYHLTLMPNADRSLTVKRGTSTGTTLGSSAAGVIPDDQWSYVEFKAFINDTSGTYDVYVDGTNVLTGTGDTKNSSVEGASQIALFGAAKYDDLYVTDGAVLGDQRVDTVFPNASGLYTQWTPTPTTSNYLNVDESTSTFHDSNTTYNASATSGQIDLYNFTNIPELSGSIQAVIFNWVGRRGAPGVVYGRSVYNEDSTLYYGEYNQLFDTFDVYWDLWQAPPSDPPGNWTRELINSGEYGAISII